MQRPRMTCCVPRLHLSQAEPAEDTQDEAAADAMDTDGEAVPATPATPAPATPATPAPAQTPAVEATPAAEPADVRHRYACLPGLAAQPRRSAANWTFSFVS